MLPVQPAIVSDSLAQTDRNAGSVKWTHAKLESVSRWASLDWNKTIVSDDWVDRGELMLPTNQLNIYSDAIYSFTTRNASQPRLTINSESSKVPHSYCSVKEQTRLL